jgi:hypothetical protein
MLSTVSYMVSADSPPSELVNATEVARRLGLSGERVRQLAAAGTLPPAVGRVGRNNVWRWDDVQDWAVAVGRLEADPNSPLRVRPTIWTIPHPKEPLINTVDDILSWGRGGNSLAHIRVWEPSSPGRSATVLLGSLEDSGGRSITNDIEGAVDAVYSRWPEVGSHSDWFEYWPGRDSVPLGTFSAVTFETTDRGLPSGSKGSRRMQVASPRWYRISRSQFERFVGQPVDCYQEGTYTSTNIRARRPGQRLEVPWDPYGLRHDLRCFSIIAQSADLPSATKGFCASILAGGLAAGLSEIRKDIQEQPESSAAVKVAPAKVDDIDRLPRDYDAERALSEDINASLSHLFLIREWLQEHDDQSAMLLLPGPLGLAWPERFMAGAQRADDDPPSEDSASIVTAMRRVDFAASWRLWRDVPGFRERDHPLFRPSVHLPSEGAMHTRYLETIAWWGPRPEHQLRARQLEARLREEECPAQFGYDPWGRLICRSVARDQFVVEWPTEQPGYELTDDLHIVADNHPQSRAVFIELPDNRLDLLPAEPQDSVVPEFTWGYYGSGPNAFAGALIYLCGGQPERLRSKEPGIRAASRRVLDMLASQTNDLHIGLGDIRDLLGRSSA